MRIWHRSTSACTAAPVVSSMCKWSRIVGEAAAVSGFAPVHAKSRSAMSAAWRFDSGAPVEIGKESVDVLPHLVATLEARPVLANQADQLVAGIDRHYEA